MSRDSTSIALFTGALIVERWGLGIEMENYDAIDCSIITLSLRVAGEAIIRINLYLKAPKGAI